MTGLADIRLRGLAALLFATGATATAAVGATPASGGDPPWLRLAPGVAARVDLAAWPTFDEPEAALAASPGSLAHDFSADLARPNDVVYEPVGVRVRVVRILGGGRIALVRGISSDWRAFAPVDRMLPEIPPGTRLRAAGSFAGFANLYPALDGRDPEPVATGTALVALGMAAATDPNAADLVRVRVRVLGGPARNRVGWIPATSTGLPEIAPVAGGEEAAKACACRIVRFAGTP